MRTFGFGDYIKLILSFDCHCLNKSKQSSDDLTNSVFAQRIV